METQWVPGATAADIERSSVQKYLERHGLWDWRPLRPDPVDDYRNLGIVRDHYTRPLLTLYGALAFGIAPQSLYQLKNLFIRNTAYAGRSRASEVLMAQDAKGRLDEQVEESLRWAESFGHRESRSGWGRSNRPALLLRALREALANAVIHRNYDVKRKPITLEVFRDRVEVGSPGCLPRGMTLEKLRCGGVIRTSNEDMAHFATVSGLMERRGMGWPLIENAMHEFNGTEPQITEGTSQDGGWEVRVTLTL